ILGHLKLEVLAGNLADAKVEAALRGLKPGRGRGYRIHSRLQKGDAIVACPFPVLIAVTFASGIAAPVVSVIVPAISPETSDCAPMLRGARTSTAGPAMTISRVVGERATGR